MIGAIAGDIIGSVYETSPFKTVMQTVTPLPASPVTLPKHTMAPVARGTLQGQEAVICRPVLDCPTILPQIWMRSGEKIHLIAVRG